MGNSVAHISDLRKSSAPAVVGRFDCGGSFSEVDSGWHSCKAGWRTSAKLEVPSNITLMPLPAKRPELNRRKTSGSSCAQLAVKPDFLSYDDLLDHCCEAWNKPTAQPGATCPSQCANGRTGSNQWELVLLPQIAR
jgi:hypothetical protein